MTSTTDFERVRRALLRRGEGDRVPFFELSIHQSIKSKILGREVRTREDEVDFWKTAGYDFVSTRAGVRSIVRGLHPTVVHWVKRKAGNEPEKQSSSWVNESSGIIRTRQDFAEFPWPKPEDLGGYNDYVSLPEYFGWMGGHLPAGMKLIVQLGYVFMGAWQIMGFENFGIQLADDPEFIQLVVDKLAGYQAAVLEMLVQYDCVGAIWMPDDLCYNAGPVVSPRVYRRYIYPWYVKLIERCHQAGLPVGLHSDGGLARLLPDLVECGFDCIHPFEPPLNDMARVKREWGHRLAVAGGIDLKAVLCNGTPQAVADEVRRQVAVLAPGGGWLLGSSNSIPDFTPVENYRALLRAGMEHGWYAPTRVRTV